MPRILKHTPRWLSRPSAGFDAFNVSPSHTPDRKATPENGIRNSASITRKAASRGTELFVVVGNELRWTDLVMLKEIHEAQQQHQSIDTDHDRRNPYRVLRVPVYRQITQLTVSPSGDYLAISTSHTVHIAVLPESEHLNSDDTGPLKLKTYQVGPTQHVLDQSRLVSALWHPLGLVGACLITISEDAVLRLWEFDRDNRWSVSDPATALDLRRLVNGSSSDQDFSPSKSLVFSPDTFDMEVAAACLGGASHPSEEGWAPMTLWVAMRGGDLYALCPLLPKRFTAPQRLIERLGRSVALQCQDIESDKAASNDQLRNSLHRLTWVMELLEQHNTFVNMDEGTKTYTRPTRPSLTPMLQGPFHVEPDADTIYDVTDMLVIAATEPMKSTESGDGDQHIDGHHKARSNLMGALCMATSDNRVHICFDTNRTGGVWLPARKTNSKTAVQFNDSPLPELLLVDSVQLGDPSDTGCPIFTPDPCSHASVFVTHANAVEHLSIEDWMGKLNDETTLPGEAGSAFRLRTIVEATQTKIECAVRKEFPTSTKSKEYLTEACIALSDSDLGYFVMTRASGQPLASQLASSDHSLFADRDGSESFADFDEEEYTIPLELRETYQPPQELWSETTLHRFMTQYMAKDPRRNLRDQIRISPFSLNLMTEAHHVLSQETHRLNGAVSTLFSRCERLQSEFTSQIERACAVANEIDSVLDDDADVLDDEADPPGTVENISRRLEGIENRSESLAQRYETIRQKVSKLDKRPLNDKERPWMSEVTNLDKLVGGEAVDPGNEETNAAASLTRRLDDIRTFKNLLVTQSDERGGGGDEPMPDQAHTASSKKPKPRTAEIETMLRRETVLVEMMQLKLTELSKLI